MFYGFRELGDVLPALSHDQVQKLLAEMKREQSIYVKGRTRAARWYPSPNGEDVHGNDIED